ncbi:MAG: Lrp/AsnC family transcriptional regulator [archaeon]
MMELDLIDRKLMHELDFDARQSYSQLAKKIRVSQEVIRYRLKRLIDNKIIDAFLTIVDIGRLGLFHYEVYFRFQHVSGEKEKEIVKFLMDSYNVLWLCSCTGHFDLVFSVIAKNNIDFSNIISRITNLYGEFISERNVQSTIKIPHFNRAYLLNKKEVKEVTFGGTYKKKVDIDRIDFKILKTIRYDGRMPITEIAKKARITIDIAKYRLRRLRRTGVIQTFRPSYNKKNMGYTIHQTLFNFKNLNESLKNKFIEFVKKTSNTVYVLDTIGRFDLILETETKSEDDFERILKSIRNQFYEFITTYETIAITEEHQMDYFHLDEEDFFK